jgi:hypothetical protein
MRFTRVTAPAAAPVSALPVNLPVIPDLIQSTFVPFA